MPYTGAISTDGSGLLPSRVKTYPSRDGLLYKGSTNEPKDRSQSGSGDSYHLTTSGWSSSAEKEDDYADRFSEFDPDDGGFVSENSEDEAEKAEHKRLSGTSENRKSETNSSISTSGNSLFTSATMTAYGSAAVCTNTASSLLSSSSSPLPPPSHHLLTHLGDAERCRRLSRKTGGFLPLQHSTADDDTADGFSLYGFFAGCRVYLLDSPLRARLAAAVMRTAIGLSFVDVDALCPPQVRVQPNTPINGGLFVVRSSPLGGLGTFAVAALPYGTHILAERPLVRTTLFHLCRALARLPPPQRDAYFCLHGHHPDVHASLAERIWTANTFAAGSTQEAVFAVASRFNHACSPRNNVGYHYDRYTNLLVLTTIRPIAAGAELYISYGKTPRMLYERFGFRCTCGACAGYAADEADHQPW